MDRSIFIFLSLQYIFHFMLLLPASTWLVFSLSTGNDRYSGHGYSGIDRYSGTKNPDDAILFTVSGITALVEQKFRFFLKILMRCSILTVV